jgi:hypothetical protein
VEGVILVGRGDVNRHQQCQMWWSGDCAHCWAHWACWARFLGAKFYILGVAGYNKPIWDVFAHKGEREEAGGHFSGAKLLLFSQLGKRCQLGFLGLSFAAGLVGLGFS